MYLQFHNFSFLRHNEAVQSMHFNPVSHQLLSCSLSDIAFWSAEQKAVQKHKSGGRVNCCAWTRDGQYLALGLAAGYVSIRNKVYYSFRPYNFLNYIILCFYIFLMLNINILNV